MIKIHQDDLLEFWNMFFIKKDNLIEIRFSPSDFINIDFDSKHGYIKLEQRQYPKKVKR